MKTLRFALAVVLLGAWMLGAGCDDTRPVVDVGPGGQPEAEGGQATAGEAFGEGGTPASPLAGAGGQAGVGVGVGVGQAGEGTAGGGGASGETGANAGAGGG